MSMLRTSTKAALFALLLILAALLTACGSSAEKLNNKGNDAFLRQEYAEALVNYQRAQAEAPKLAQAYYNAANTFYREGDYGSALQQLHMALSLTSDKAVAKNSLFNIGNSQFSSQDLMAAVDSYRQVLLLDPQDMDAKYNLELALQQQQQQQEQQDQSGDGEDQSQSQDEQEQKPEEEEGQEQEQQQSEEQADQNQEESQESEQSQEQPEGQPQPSQTPPPGQKMTEEQARQLLAAIGKNTDTLQERLGMILMATGRPPVQDW